MGNVVLAYGGIPIQQGLYEESTKKTDLGTPVPFLDGRIFRYAKCNAGTGITKGHMAESPTVVANESSITQTAMTNAISGASIGAKVIKVLLTAAIAANLYEDGYLTIESSTGLGQCFRIKSNKAGGGAVATPCELTLYDPLVVALSATSVISLTKNKYANVVVCPSTPVGVPIGVPLITVTAGKYFWAQTRGCCALEVATMLTIGRNVGPSGAGHCAYISGTSANKARYGVALQTATAAAYGLVDLMLE